VRAQQQRDRQLGPLRRRHACERFAAHFGFGMHEGRVQQFAIARPGFGDLRIDRHAEQDLPDHARGKSHGAGQQRHAPRDDVVLVGELLQCAVADFDLRRRLVDVARNRAAHGRCERREQLVAQPVVELDGTALAARSAARPRPECGFVEPIVERRQGREWIRGRRIEPERRRPARRLLRVDGFVDGFADGFVDGFAVGCSVPPGSQRQEALSPRRELGGVRRRNGNRLCRDRRLPHATRGLAAGRRRHHFDEAAGRAAVAIRGVHRRRDGRRPRKAPDDGRHQQQALFARLASTQVGDEGHVRREALDAARVASELEAARQRAFDDDVLHAHRRRRAHDEQHRTTDRQRSGDARHLVAESVRQGAFAGSGVARNRQRMQRPFDGEWLPPRRVIRAPLRLH